MHRLGLFCALNLFDSEKKYELFWWFLFRQEFDDQVSFFLWTTFIACRSDLAELLKSWFLINNITENSRSCQLALGVFSYFFGYFYSKLSIKLGRICEKDREGHHGHQTIENQLWQAVWVWIDPIFEPKNGRDFSLMLWTVNELFSSSAGSDSQIISDQTIFVKMGYARYPRKSHSKLDELQWHSIGEPQMRNNCLPFITKIPDTKTVYFQANGRRDGKMSSATTLP